MGKLLILDNTHFLIWLISVDLEPISDGSFVALENTSFALEAAHALKISCPQDLNRGF